MKFTKMHGTGNDYIYINGFEEEVENPSELAKKTERQTQRYWFRRIGLDIAFGHLRLPDANVQCRWF